MPDANDSRRHVGSHTVYEHTQRSPLALVLLITASFLFAGAWITRVGSPGIALVLALIGGIVIVLAFCFGSMTVAVTHDELRIRYGPLPLFRKTLPLGFITAVRRGRSGFIDGWGIHYIPGRGWTFNLWGTDCVVLDLNGRTVRVGTDDADALAEHLRVRAGGMGTR